MPEGSKLGQIIGTVAGTSLGGADDGRAGDAVGGQRRPQGRAGVASGRILGLVTEEEGGNVSSQLASADVTTDGEVVERGDLWTSRFRELDW